MEDIEILENIIESYKDCFVEYYPGMVVDCTLNSRDLQAIENLITRNKELEDLQDYYIDKIKRLEAENKALIMNLGIVTDDDMKHIPCID